MRIIHENIHATHIVILSAGDWYGRKITRGPFNKMFSFGNKSLLARNTKDDINNDIMWKQ